MAELKFRLLRRALLSSLSDYGPELQSTVHRRFGRAVLGVMIGSVGGFTGVFLEGATNATAYPILDNMCHFTSLQMMYSGPNWSSDYVDAWDTGAARWNGVKDPYGNPWWFSGTGNYHPVYRSDLPNGLQGQTTCYPDGSLYFDLDSGLSLSLVSAVAAHEAGHAHGLQHSGAFDAHGPGESAPVMSTCTTRNRNVLTSDSVAAEAERESNTLHANASFENGLYYWSTESGGSLSLYGASASEGTYSARFDVSSVGVSTFQTVRNAAIPPSYRSRVNYKDANSNAGGTITIQLEARPVAYAYNGNPDCGWVNGWDWNSASLNNGPNFFQVGPSTQVSVNDGWSYNGSTSPWNDASSWQAVDVRLRIYKNTSTPLYFDYARAYR